MKKTILKAIGFILLVVAGIFLFMYDMKVEYNPVGKRVVILSDTFLIVEYDYMGEVVTLDNGRTISIHFIKDWIIRDKK